MIVVGVLVFMLGVIALAWWLVLRRINEGSFEVSRSLHPPWKRRIADAGGDDVPDEQAPVRAYAAERQLEREEHAAASKGLDQAKDRNVGRSWGG